MKMVAIGAGVLVAVGVAGVVVWQGMETETPPVPASTPTPAAPVSTPPASEPQQPVAPAEPRDMRRFGVAEPALKAEGAIRLATYNVLNLFDDVDDPSLSDRYEDIDDEKPVEQLEALAKTIRLIDADILAVQEIESLDALTAFRDEYLADLGYEHIASIDAGDERGIEQSVLSRYPITHMENWPKRELGGVHPEKYGTQENWYAGEPIVFHRSPLRVDIEVPGETAYGLTLFVMHHKSGRYSGYWRDAESKGDLEMIAEAVSGAPDRNVAVLGDFNDLPSAPSVMAFKDAGFTSVFGAEPGIGPEYTTHESGRTIDFILVNEALGAEVIAGSARVIGTPARPAGADYRTTPPPEGFASDHYPVIVDLIPVENSQG